MRRAAISVSRTQLARQLDDSVTDLFESRGSVKYLRRRALGGVHRMDAAMTGQESAAPCRPRVPVEDRGIDRRQIDHHQGVQCVSELRVDVESKQLRVQLQVLPQQDRARLFRRLLPRRSEPIRLLK